jgi:hypothetical protein
MDEFIPRVIITLDGEEGTALAEPSFPRAELESLIDGILDSIKHGCNHTASNDTSTRLSPLARWKREMPNEQPWNAISQVSHNSETQAVESFVQHGCSNLSTRAQNGSDITGVSVKADS